MMKAKASHNPIVISGLCAREFIMDLNSETNANLGEKDLEMLMIAKKIVHRSK